MLDEPAVARECVLDTSVHPSVLFTDSDLPFCSSTTQHQSGSAGRFQSLSQSQSPRPTPRPFLPVPPIPLTAALTFPGIPAHLQYPLINLMFSSQSSTCIHGNKVSFSAHDNPSSPIVPSPESSPSRLHNNHTRSQHLDPLQRVFVWSEPFSGSRIVTFVFIVVLPIFFSSSRSFSLKMDDPERPNYRI